MDADAACRDLDAGAGECVCVCGVIYVVVGFNAVSVEPSMFRRKRISRCSSSPPAQSSSYGIPKIPI
eukprot:scaffold1267_cov171-Amphora_coffeaeformis.AAC.28